jgi:2-phospho-L-lactate/phosphoenolpyruvate guanylyltransferase
MSRRTVAIVPLRSPGVGKTRLATALDPDQRALLSGAMLGDVTFALAGSRVDEVLVAAGGTAAAAAAAAIGMPVVSDAAGAQGLNRALADATRRVGPGCDVLVVTADLPRLTAEDVDAVLAMDAEVVVAPSSAGGTGGLLRRPGDRIATRFGPASAVRHRELALAAGCRVRTLERDGFRYDVDTWTDLVALHEVEVGAATAAVLPRVLGRPARAG